MLQRLSMEYKLNKFECYDGFYLSDDMENMAYLFEFCSKYSSQLYGVVFNPIDFINAFMVSSIRRIMEIGHPRLLSQAAIDTFKMFIEIDCGGNYSQFCRPCEEFFDYMQLYWCGMMYAFMHYKSKVSSRDLIKRIPLREMLIEYICGHQMGEEQYYSRIEPVVTGIVIPKRRVPDEPDDIKFEFAE